ncbi:hypothetical protein dqs_2513 [Azoarcus olearius]|uniref:tripartite tricarboxylate transporter TctB family protein n=1 Tax=Azoarcus sp. (strain BH72) TaxID=418699 RepID=UPI0008060FB5|nr:tripartite tricarboxylate transporter TctB family protein [Azoarcus olearius]ANQ85543.1 hypothetical protein dqs_2513 [Azoarcus olearius]
MRIDWQDGAAGLVFAALGGVALWLGGDYAAGTTMRMGAGYFPRVLGTLLLVLGLALLVRAPLRAPRPLPPVAWRALLALGAAGMLFALLLAQAGLALAAVVMVVAARCARPALPAHETLSLALVLAALAVLVFPLALGLPLPRWPAF